MSVEDRRVVQAGPCGGPATRSWLGDRPESIALFTYLLDADGELAEEFDVRARIAARQLATARVLQVGVGACDLGPWFEATAGGPRAADPGRPARARDPGRRPHRGRAGRPRGSAAAARPSDRSAAHPHLRVARAASDEARRPRRRLRRSGQAVSADRAHPRAPRLPPPARARRAPGDHLPAPARRSPGPAAVAPGRALGSSRADGACACRCRSPTACSVSWWRPSGRRSRTRSSGSAQAGLVTGATDDLHLHGTLEHQLEALTEREPARD